MCQYGDGISYFGPRVGDMGLFTFFAMHICSRGFSLACWYTEDLMSLFRRWVAKCLRVCTYVHRAWSLAHWGVCLRRLGRNRIGRWIWINQWATIGTFLFFSPISVTRDADMEDFGASWHFSERVGNFRYQAAWFWCIPSITERVSCLGVDLPGALKSLLLRGSELKRISATAKNTARKKRTFCNSRTFDLLTHASLSWSSANDKQIVAGKGPKEKKKHGWR